MKFLQSKKFQTNLYLGLSGIIVLLMGYYTYTNLTKFLDMRSEISINETLHGTMTETDTNVQNELNTINADNVALKKTINEEVDLVLPSNENHTFLTRTLEKFESDRNRVKDPFNISNLQYQKPEAAGEKAYRKLPFKLTIHSSYSNFFKFLEFIQNSGTLSDGTRLLDIDTININFISPKGSESNTSGQDEINFNIAMNAYIKS